MTIPHITYLSGDKTNLRPVNDGDLDAMFRYVNDPEIMKYMGTSTPIAYRSEQEWIERMQKPNQDDFVFAVEIKEEKIFLGTMGLHGIDLQNGVARTGALFGNKEYLGKGYGTDAKTVLLRWAFNTFPLRKVCSTVFGPNARSRRYLEKSGYKTEGVREKQQFIDGEYVDEHLVAIFREDFQELFGL